MCTSRPLTLPHRNCHRRKLKCDKKQPCSRCVQAGSADDCVYQPLPSESKKTPSVEPPEDVSFSGSLSGSMSSCEPPPAMPKCARSFYRASDGQARVSGTTHWANIASEVSLPMKLVVDFFFFSCRGVATVPTACQDDQLTRSRLDSSMKRCLFYSAQILAGNRDIVK